MWSSDTPVLSHDALYNNIRIQYIITLKQIENKEQSGQQLKKLTTMLALEQNKT